jgi:hypothetical protein
MITANNTTYKDDFIDNGVEDKNYLRILFNGGRSVQIRELNQLQSIIQSQIDKFGSSVWKTGTNVIGGACTFDRKVHAFTFNTVDLIGPEGSPTGVVIDELDTLIQDFIVADVIDYVSDELTTTFYARYSSGGGEDSTAGVFNIVDNIGLESRVLGGISTSVEAVEATTVAGAFLSQGVFFINGCFVVTPKQNVFVALPEVGGISGRVVLEVAEKNVTYIEDPTLLDNADGNPNHLAPGADRYQITLTLGFLDADAEADDIDRITLLEIVDSNVVLNSKVRYTDLDRQLAQRTFEESGNYVVNPFKIEIANLLDSQRPGSLESDASENVYIGLEPSVAYVDGYRIELSKKLDLTAPRARTTSEKAVSVSLNFGNFVDVSLEAGSNIPLPNTVNLTYDLKNAGATTIGTTRIKSVESVGSFFRLFLYDINLTGSYNISDIDHIVNVTAGVDLQAESAVQDTSLDTGIFALPYTNVRSLAAINPSDFTYVIKKIFLGSANGSGEFTIATGANETFEDSSVVNFTVESNGTWLPIGGFTVTSASSSSITLGGLTASQPVKVLFPVRVASNTPATKTLVTIVDEVIAPVGDKYTLTTADIFDIDTVVINGSSTDITSDIVISSDGQRPSKYTNGELQYTGTGTPPTIKVTYRHFSHNGLPFTINSYPINWDEDAVLAADEIRYKDVPSFGKYTLSDCVDFRPVILAGAGTTTSIQPDPNSPLTCKPTFFLSRTDKVIVNSNGEFKIVTGVPALIPTVPLTPPASMALFELQFPAYTFEASDIKINYVDNRRYTMRDIGALDKRINNLEYYTSLSLLETSISNKSIFDDVQGARFKNGILVDAFAGHSVGDVFNPAYRCSIDNAKGILRPRFKTDAVDLVYNAGTSTNVRLNENTVTLNFTETPLISQLTSSESESVNPYDVATFVGSVKLFPTNDTWMEVNRRPDVIINDNGAYDALAFSLAQQGILGAQWNSWETNWSGVIAQTASKPHSVADANGTLRRTITTTTQANISRSGTFTELTSATVYENKGDRIIDISFVPFIRSRRVYFQCKALKPDTKVYPFFDGISIADYTSTTSAVVNSSQLTEIREFINKQPGDSGFITPTDLVSDSDGELIGQFIVPNNSVLKFRTGERVFRVTDSETNLEEEETTYAEGTYVASGTAQTVEATIVATRVPQIRQTRLAESLVVTDTQVRWEDPLAQTFIINNIKEGAFVTSLDLWFTSKSKSGLPVTIRIVATDNGYPTQRAVPFSEVTLRASDVNIWNRDPLLSDGSTNFAFSDPVYLKGGVEYAIVILSNDPMYRLRVSRLGGLGEDGKVIQTNPYGGVMFMSQNASTWTPDQTRDIKFVLNRAVFNPLVVGAAEFKSIMREGVQSIGITGAGTSYVGATITIAAPVSGVTATAEPIIDLVSGTIIGARVTDPGSGYTTAPVVTINRVPAGGGTNATAVATLFNARTSAFNLIQNTLVTNEAAINNELVYGATTYEDVKAYENRLPITDFTVTRANRATIASELITSSEYITPVIDLNGMSLLCIENEINNLTTDEDTAYAGSALSRYFTREVELNDPADQLNIYLDVNRPTENTNIALYVKLKYDSETYSDWILVEPQTKVAISDNSDTYTESQFIYNSAANDFISFAVKIVFTSANIVDVTTAKNLRIIATS